jgi:hypothetical protein
VDSTPFCYPASLTESDYPKVLIKLVGYGHGIPAVVETSLTEGLFSMNLKETILKRPEYETVPELILGTPWDRIDMWGLGLTVHALLTITRLTLDLRSRERHAISPSGIT